MLAPPFSIHFNFMLSALGIESLGHEIIASISALIGNDKTLRSPESRRIIDEELTGMDRTWFVAHLGLTHDPPRVCPDSPMKFVSLFTGNFL
jgi:hypothetical protein